MSLQKISIKKEYLKAVGEFSAQGGSANWRKKFNASFDYDGDRLLIKNFRGDIIGGILADIIAKKGDVIVYDLRCSHAIPEYFRNKGIVVIPSRVGHYNVKKLMRERKAVFGMEMTGHYYFKEFHYCESPLYGLKKLNEHMNKTGKSLAELAKPFTKYFHSGIIDIKISKIKSKISNLIERLKEKYRNGAQNHLDGLTIEFSNWWFNIRPSHTEPIFTLAVEAKTKELLETKKKELKQFLLSS
jgi:phosphomannomutase